MDLQDARDIWLEAVEAAGRSPATIKAYRCHLSPFFRFLAQAGATEVEEITPFIIRRFLIEYGASRSPKSVQTVFGAIRAWLRFLAAEEAITASPTDKMKAPKAPQTVKDAYSMGQIRALLKVLGEDRSPLGLRDGAIVSVLIDTGCRMGELLATSLDDLEDGALLLRHTKGKRPRMAPLGEKAQRALSAYLRRGRPRLEPQSNTLFLTRHGRALRARGLQSLLLRLSENVGFPLSAHKFRHTWATQMLRKGVDLETLRRLGGWADYSMLRTYAHLSANDLRIAQARHSLLDGLGRRR